jgi:hypothetical protein
MYNHRDAIEMPETGLELKHFLTERSYPLVVPTLHHNGCVVPAVTFEDRGHEPVTVLGARMDEDLLRSRYSWLEWRARGPDDRPGIPIKWEIPLLIGSKSIPVLGETKWITIAPLATNRPWQPAQPVHIILRETRRGFHTSLGRVTPTP